MFSFSRRRSLRAAAPLLATLAGSLCLSSVGTASTYSFKTLYTFNPATDGNVPYASLVEGADGRFYGTNSANGKNSTGTVFSIKNDGTGFTILSSFPDTNGGSQPRGGVVQAHDGNFYGTTYAGGNNGYGTLYQVTPAGTLTYLFTKFTNGDPGGSPVGTLVEGLDSNLYGTAEYGGVDNDGTVFRATVPGGVTSTFAPITGGLGGVYPECDLIQAYDSNFYGTTSAGGTYSNGTFFRVTPGGVLTTLYSFTGSSDGLTPLRGVVQGTDGAFYGTTQTGGAYSSGAIYRIVVSGTTATLTALYDFDPLLGDGSTPDGNLTLASDGNLYGTTAMGGAYNAGTVFRVTTSGGFATVYNFTTGSDGGFPVGGVVQGNDGRLYGTTAGENGSSGTIFRIDLGLADPAPAPFAALVSTTASPGDTILIKGKHFVGTTAVGFASNSGGAVAAASFVVESDTVIQAVLPSTAASGNITVTANGLTGTSVYPLSVNSTPVVVVPSVSAVTDSPIAAASGTVLGKIRLQRAGSDNSQPLTVNFKLTKKSTAPEGVAFYLLAGKTDTLTSTDTTITIPAGKGGITIKVVPIQETTVEPPETVIFKVVAGNGYTVDPNNLKAVVTVLDDNDGQ